jgi:hypothetical protein
MDMGTGTGTATRAEMAWKKKEKQLTPEEAVAQAKRDLAPFWHGCDPMIAAVRGPNGVTAHPLDTEFSSRPWLLFFLDPTDFSGEAALVFAREWHKRYREHDLHMLIVFRPGYGWFRSPGALTQLTRRHQIPCPVVLDAEELLTAAFDVGSLPKVLLLDHGKRVFESAGHDWISDTELQLQRFLRIADPGLPLALPFQSPKPLVRDVGRTELGRGRGVAFPKPGFTVAESGFGAGVFPGDRPRKLEPGAVAIGGTWLQDGDRVATSDPKAWIAFRAPSVRVALVAQSLSKNSEATRIVVEVNGIPAFDTFAAENLIMDEDGQSLVKVDALHLYHVLDKLPSDSREITLRFPIADRVAAALYGIRFGE